jgi:hypothetical protein
MSRPTTVAGRVSGSLFFLAFLGGGVLFCGLIVQDVIRRAQTRFGSLQLQGEIPRWSALKEEFEIQVRPGARTAAA